ncbi:MAG: DUF58 domain-containing protein, partial [Acidimicrobiales bacterium]
MKRGAPVPTRRGWRALALAGGLVAAGRVFGIVELYMLAVASAGLVGACLVQSQWRRPRLSARRSVSPTRIHVGDEVSVDVVVANLGPRATPSLHAIDYLGRRRPPMEAPLGWIESKGQGGFSYHIACQARGLHRLGPVSTEAEDAFGLVRTRSDCGGEAQFLAYPRLESLDAQDLAGTEESRGSLARSRSRPGPGEDFHALRPYEIGDDLRRVHWPSVARTGALMIRKEETQYRQRLTVALDLRRVVHSPDTLEAAVSAAASILAADRPGCLTRLVSGDGFSSGFGAGSNHLEAILMHLALARMVPDQTADGLLAGLR